MSILFFTDGCEALEEKMKKVIKEKFPEEQPEICRSLKNLLLRCRKPKGDFSFQILTAMDYCTLKILVSIRELLFDLPVILILPDEEIETKILSYELYPRFVDTVNSNFTDIGLVLEKMMLSKRIKNNG